MSRAQIAILPDGRRHFHDGPIDLILKAEGEGAGAAYEAAAARFATILDELCRELPRLRASSGPRPQGVVARRMADAVAPFAEARFLTPMAAVAGAVAEEVLAAMVNAAPLQRAYVNNGGDIALHLARRPAVPSPLVGEGKGGGRFAPRRVGDAPSPTLPREGGGGGKRGSEEPSFAIGMVGRPDQPNLFGKARITASDTARGVATSGWRGRSFSLGIADAVTVIAGAAALADAAATLIANAVDLPRHPAIARAPASSRDPQSDLGERLVTVGVGPLRDDEIDEALTRGAREAAFWRARGWIEAAALRLGDHTRLVAAPSAPYASPSLVSEPCHAFG